MRSPQPCVSTAMGQKQKNKMVSMVNQQGCGIINYREYGLSA